MCVSAWVSNPPVIARDSTMITFIPFLRLSDCTHPQAARTCDTPASCPGQADQTGSSGGCLKTWGPADRSISRQPERHRPIRRSGRDPGLRRYASTRPKPGKQGRKHYPHPPCRLGGAGSRVDDTGDRVQITALCAVAVGNAPPNVREMVIGRVALSLALRVLQARSQSALICTLWRHQIAQDVYRA